MKRKELEFFINEDGCHVVTSHVLDKDGYGKFTRGGKNWQIHRYVYTQNHGEIPKGLVVMHSCDNPSCINPDHLSLGTQLDNAKDMIEKGRAGKRGRPTGYRPPLRKTTESSVAQLRVSKGLSQSELAEQAEIHQSTLAKIEAGTRNGSVKAMRNIANVLHVSIDELLN